MVNRAGAHSTDPEAPEPVEDLCAKTKPVADAWKPVAERIWEDQSEPLYAKRCEETQGMAETDMTRFERLGRKRQPMPEREQA